MLNFIHMNLECKSNGILFGLVNFSKAFNRIDHNLIVTILGNLNIPTCALQLVISYLSGRKMCVRQQGAGSTDQYIPGGDPQGSLLTVILFVLQVNLAGAPCSINPILPTGTAGPVEAGPLPMCHQLNKILKKKFVNDLTMLESLDLQSVLVRSPSIIGPANIHEQNGLLLLKSQSSNINYRVILGN